MTFLRLSAALATFTLFCVTGVQGQTVLDSLTSDLNIEGLETTYDPDTGLAIAKGDVHISYSDVEIRCGMASYNATTGEVIARDEVVIWKAGITYKGDNIIYNANTGDISGDAVRSSMPMAIGNFFYSADKFETKTKLIQRVDATDTYLTTHDSEKPNFRLRARSLTIYPDDRVVLKNVTVLAGDTPVFYLPSISQPLDDEANYKFNPGYQSRWGAFLLNQYSAIHGDHTLAKYHLDLRSARGVGVGGDFRSLRQKSNWANLTGLKLYYQNDTDPSLNKTSVPRGPVPTNRYRVNFQHRIYLPGPEKSTWYMDFDINKISDAHFYEDFFFNDYRGNPEPDNQLSLIHSDPRYVASLMARFQANNFYAVGEKLPELSIDWTRRPLWNSGIFHQGTLSAGVYRNQLSNTTTNTFQSLQNYAIAGVGGGGGNPNKDLQIADFLGLPRGAAIGVPEYAAAQGLLGAQLGGTGFGRVHTYHELLYPKTLLGWLNVVPRIGAGFTHYAGIDGGIRNVNPTNGVANNFNSFTRGIFHAGLDVSFKVSKNWEDYRNDTLGLDGLRHTMQPYANVSYLSVNSPSGIIPKVDGLSRTTRPRSIDVPLYSAVDDLRSWNVTRLGVRNYLQTRRDYTKEYNNSSFLSANDSPEQTYTLAGMNTYVDAFFDDPEFNRSLSNLYNELFFRPVPWANLWMDMQLPITGGKGNYTELNQGITFMPSNSLSVTLGHQYISDNPYFQNSNLMFSRIYARLTDNWGLAANHVFEMDDGTLEFQSYSVTRDLTSWIASIGAMMRDNRGGRSEIGVLFSLTLKDFPGLTLPLDIDPNPSGRGGSQSSSPAYQ